MDQDDPSRPLVERVLIGFAMVLAIAGLIAGAWWLVSQTGVGSVVRDSSPNWTPAGDVVFTSESNGKTDIVVTDRSGGNRRTLIESPGNDDGAAFARDGSQLAFQSDRDGNFEIYVARPDGGMQTPITHDPAIDQMPTWSRDGTKIVFMSNRASGQDFDLYRMNPDGSELERLTTGGASGFAEYAPDGKQLVLHTGRDLFIMSLATGGLRKVTRDPANGMHATWSPDGQQLAFMSSRNGRMEIFTSLVDGREAKVLVTMPKGDAIDPRWSPNGQYIAFVHVPEGLASAQGQSGQRIVYVVEVSSGRLQRVSK